jgi:hypothetical protein
LTYARKIDSTQPDIVAALRAAGFMVWLIGTPCDALTWRADKGFQCVEIKTANRKGGKYKPRKDQKAQNDFCELTGTPRVCSPSDAVAALGGVTFTGESNG